MLARLGEKAAEAAPQAPLVARLGEEAAEAQPQPPLAARLGERDTEAERDERDALVARLGPPDADTALAALPQPHPPIVGPGQGQGWLVARVSPGPELDGAAPLRGADLSLRWLGAVALLRAWREVDGVVEALAPPVLLVPARAPAVPAEVAGVPEAMAHVAQRRPGLLNVRGRVSAVSAPVTIGRRTFFMLELLPDRAYPAAAAAQTAVVRVVCGDERQTREWQPLLRVDDVVLLTRVAASRLNGRHLVLTTTDASAASQLPEAAAWRPRHALREPGVVEYSGAVTAVLGDGVAVLDGRYALFLQCSLDAAATEEVLRVGSQVRLINAHLFYDRQHLTGIAACLRTEIRVLSVGAPREDSWGFRSARLRPHYRRHGLARAVQAWSLFRQLRALEGREAALRLLPRLLPDAPPRKRDIYAEFLDHPSGHCPCFPRAEPPLVHVVSLQQAAEAEVQGAVLVARLTPTLALRDASGAVPLVLLGQPRPGPEAVGALLCLRVFQLLTEPCVAVAAAWADVEVLEPGLGPGPGGENEVHLTHVAPGVRLAEAADGSLLHFEDACRPPMALLEPGCRYALEGARRASSRRLCVPPTATLRRLAAPPSGLRRPVGIKGAPAGVRDLTGVVARARLEERQADALPCAQATRSETHVLKLTLTDADDDDDDTKLVVYASADLWPAPGVTVGAVVELRRVELRVSKGGNVYGHMRATSTLRVVALASSRKRKRKRRGRQRRLQPADQPAPRTVPLAAVYDRDGEVLLRAACVTLRLIELSRRCPVCDLALCGCPQDPVLDVEALGVVDDGTAQALLEIRSAELLWALLQFSEADAAATARLAPLTFRARAAVPGSWTAGGGAGAAPDVTDAAAFDARVRLAPFDRQLWMRCRKLPERAAEQERSQTIQIDGVDVVTLALPRLRVRLLEVEEVSWGALGASSS